MFIVKRIFRNSISIILILLMVTMTIFVSPLRTEAASGNQKQAQTQTVEKTALGIKSLWASQHSVGKVLFKWSARDGVKATGWNLKFRFRKIGGNNRWSGWTDKSYPANTYQAWIPVRTDYVIEIHAQAKGDTTWSTGIITCPAGGKYHAMKTAHVVTAANGRKLTEFNPDKTGKNKIMHTKITLKVGQTFKVRPSYDYDPGITDFRKRPRLYPTHMLYDIGDKSMISITKPDGSKYTGGIIDGTATIKGVKDGKTTITFRSPNGRTMIADVTVGAGVEKTYSVTWQNWDGTVLQTGKVRQGAIPEYPGYKPYRNADDEYLYTFTGWSPEISAADSDVIYTAQFRAEAKQAGVKYCTITWKDWDGSILTVDTVKAKEMPVYTGKTPAREGDEDWSFTFSGWKPSIVPANSNKTYRAQYDQHQKFTSYKITWKDWDGTILNSCEIKEGYRPAYNGKPLQLHEDDRYIYEFKGWPGVTEAYADATYTAEYRAIDKSKSPLGYKYRIRLLNEPYGNDANSVIYIETDNPDPSSYQIGLIEPDGDRYNHPYHIEFYEWKKWTNKSTDADRYVDLDLSKIKGSLGIYSIECKDSCTLFVQEFQEDEAGNTTDSYIVAARTIGLVDYNAEEKAWMESVIDKVTTPSMTNEQKMRAICAYIEDNYSYTRVPYGDQPYDEDGGYIYFITEESVPYWITQRHNSYTSPAMLVKFGELLDYPLHNMYGDYDREKQPVEWRNFHMYAYSEADDAYFECCPSMETGWTDLDNVPMFDPDNYKFWGE